MYARLPELQLWRGLASGKADDLNALVPDARALLVEYLFADEELLTISIAHGETGPDVAAALVPLRRRDLADKVEQSMQPAVLRDVVEWRKKAVPIAAILLEPIAARLRDRDRITIVPDDFLWKVPFEALPDGEGDLSSNSRVTYATSLATLALQRGLAASGPPITTPPASRGGSGNPCSHPRPGRVDLAGLEGAGCRGVARRSRRGGEGVQRRGDAETDRGGRHRIGCACTR